MNGGIYQIINKVTGKFYVGRSTNVYSRMYDHSYALKRDKHRRKNGKRTHLQNAWNKYGEDAFIFQPIDFFETEEEQILAEQEVIDTFWESGLLYNMTENAKGSGSRTEETRKKISKKISEYWTGRKRGPFTKEHRQKISKKLKGRTRSEEERRKQSETMKGHTVSKETRQKMSESAKNRPRVTCPHCGKEGQINGMKHYHFDNCKHKP